MWLPQWLSSKESTCNAGAAGAVGWAPGSGRSPGGRHGNTLQYFYLENAMDGEAWQATVHSVAKHQTQLKQLSTTIQITHLNIIYRPNQFYPLVFFIYF